MTLHLLQSIQIPVYQEGSNRVVEYYDPIKHEIYFDDSEVTNRFLVIFESPMGRTDPDKFRTLELAVSYLFRTIRRRSKALGLKPWFDEQVEETWKCAFGKWPREFHGDDVNIQKYEEFVRILSASL